MDEDERLPDRRPPHRRPAHLPLLRALPAEVRPGLPGERRHRERDHGAERAAEPHPLRLSGHRHAVGPGGEGHLRPRADAARGGPAHPDLRLRPQLDRTPQRRRGHPAGRDRRHQRLPAERAELPGGEVRGRRRLPLLLRRPERDDHAAQPVPGQGDLLHRVLGQPVRRPGEHLLRHAQVARPQPDHRLAAQLGRNRHQLEPGPRPVRRPARGRLRHLHPHRHRRPRRHRDQERRVLHARPPGPLRAAGGGAHRQHLVRHHRVERAGHGRGLPQPGRQHGAGRAQRERQPEHVRRARGRPGLQLHAARRGPGHLHLARHRPRLVRAAPGQPAGLDRDREPARSGRPVLHRRRGRQRGGRRREHPLHHRHRPGPGPVPPGRLRPGRSPPARSSSTRACRPATTRAATRSPPAPTA